MARAIRMALSAVLVLGVLAGPASARTLTVRSDPDDTPSRPDIRKVWTDVSPRGVFINIGAWERVRTRDDFKVVLDTRGDLDYDRLIDVVAGRCVVWKVEGGFLGDLVGERPSRRPGVRERACRLPTGWFVIGKTVRFIVENAEVGVPTDDRAPNRGRYIGL